MNGSLTRFFINFSLIFPERLLVRLKGFRKNLAKASMRLSFETYFGITVFSVIVSLATGFAVSFLIFSVVIGFYLLNPFVLPSLICLSAGGVAAAVCYAYPITVAYSKSRKIEANLPMIANFMSVLATSGMPPGKIIRSLARVADDFNVGKEMKGIVADLELLGSDLNEALRNASDRSPSKRFAAMLDGVVATSHMGGDMASYLRDQATKYKIARMLTMKTFLDNLGAVAEIYVTFMVAAPIMLIVMLSVMSFIGGGAMIGNIDPKVLLYLLSFVIIPAGIGIMILIVDSMTPPR